ncbi:MAG: hypothetical protein U0804_23860 [Gemmataceae bacterium]
MPDMTTEELARRYRENDPVEVRTVPGTDITLRVLGYVMGGHPVIHAADDERFWKWMDEAYYGDCKCRWCRDTGRVYLHGEEREPDVARRGTGTPCRHGCGSVTQGQPGIVG